MQEQGHRVGIRAEGPGRQVFQLQQGAFVCFLGAVVGGDPYADGRCDLAVEAQFRAEDIEGFGDRTGCRNPASFHEDVHGVILQGWRSAVALFSGVREQVVVGLLDRSVELVGVALLADRALAEEAGNCQSGREWAVARGELARRRWGLGRSGVPGALRRE
ncbi:hypothetical protein F1D05_09350 [Kribbella qitaiheensis]|uniref:Uncharacterized protein n=1 Tax=Kribbella qitaiheensis TaxID=1544730 RepID=A0A7G6WVP2_9ACTN|nr:hypothetical protein [Kribbella qitaiheensis]QNE18057.1 hypothetical protein F1D05_09350 [Kribbella qitaiheensis]